MAQELKPTLTSGLKRKPEENQSQEEKSSQKATKKRPRLTLGLKKKPHYTDSHDKRPRLTLGIRKKIVPASSPSPSDEKEEQATPTERHPRFMLGRKKHEFIPPSKSAETQWIETPYRGSFPRRNTIRIQKTRGRLEVNIKISDLPNWRETIKRGWHLVHINADGQIVRMKIRPRIWNKLLHASQEYPMWVASITGKMGQRIKNGFELMEPAIQVYEKKFKDPAEELQMEEFQMED